MRDFVNLSVSHCPPPWMSVLRAILRLWALEHWFPWVVKYGKNYCTRWSAWLLETHHKVHLGLFVYLANDYVTDVSYQLYWQSKTICAQAVDTGRKFFPEMQIPTDPWCFFRIKRSGEVEYMCSQYLCLTVHLFIILWGYLGLVHRARKPTVQSWLILWSFGHSFPGTLLE